MNVVLNTSLLVVLTWYENFAFRQAKTGGMCEKPIVMWLKEYSTYLSVSDVFAVVFDVILGHVVELLLLPGPTVPHCQHINS